MRKIILVSLFFLGLALTADAQRISNHAIGIRFGDNDGFGGEISYQRKLSDVNRLEVDLGYKNNKIFNAFKLTGVYQVGLEN